MSTTSLFKILVYASIIVWLFPPIRQFRKSNFYFFLILALMDPIAFIYFEIFKHTISFNYYLIGNYLLLVSVLWNSNKSEIKYSLIVVGIFYLILLFTINFSANDHLLIAIILQVVILLVFLRTFIVEYAINSKFNFFYLALVFYILTNISKFLIVLIGFADATALFIITTIAQIFFGLFFSVYRENKPGTAV